MGLFPRERQQGVYHAWQPRCGSLYNRNAAWKGFSQVRHHAWTCGVQEDRLEQKADTDWSVGKQLEFLRQGWYGLPDAVHGQHRGRNHRRPQRWDILQSCYWGVGAQRQVPFRQCHNQMQGDRFLLVRTHGQGKRLDGNCCKGFGGCDTRSDTLRGTRH